MRADILAWMVGAVALAGAAGLALAARDPDRETVEFRRLTCEAYSYRQSAEISRALADPSRALALPPERRQHRSCDYYPARAWDETRLLAAGAAGLFGLGMLVAGTALARRDGDPVG
jgi:hypothetical protein